MLGYYTSRKSGFVRGVNVLLPALVDRRRPELPLEKFLISFSTSVTNECPPPDGENTIVNFGHISSPKKNDRSGFPAERGHNQKGVLGTVVTIATPSMGSLKNPR